MLGILLPGDILAAGYRDLFLLERFHVWMECSQDLRIVYCDKVNFHVRYIKISCNVLESLKGSNQLWSGHHIDHLEKN